MVFGSEVYYGCNGIKCSDKILLDGYIVRNSDNIIFGLVVGDEGSFVEYCEENSVVYSCILNLVISGYVISLDKVWYLEEYIEDVDDGWVVDCVCNLLCEYFEMEDGVLLVDIVELRILVEELCWDELVENIEGERWEEGEEDVVEWKCLWFVNDLFRKDVLEGVLNM